MNPKAKASGGSSPKKKKQRSPRAEFIITVLKILAVFFIVITCAAAGILGGAIYGYIKTTPPLTDEQLQIKNFTTVVYDSKGNEITQLDGSENRVWVYDKDIPQNLKDAFVALEDERFYEHNGIDPKRIISVTLSLIRHGKVQGGASTITQQVVKNLTNEKQITLQRKVQEQWRALQLENKLEKWQILELYMNLIYMGYNCYGVQTASKLYFDKDVKDLDLAECASLAGITNGPALYDPFTEKGRENNKKRQAACLKLMLEQHYITQEEYDQAINEELKFKQGNISELNKASSQSYFVDQVVLEVKKDLKEKYNMTDQIALKSIYNNGYKIYTTMDSDVQKAMDDTFKDEKLFPKANINAIIAGNKGAYKQSEIEGFKKVINSEHPQAAMVIIDPKTGQVKALYGGFGEKKGSGLNRATQISRQVGSSMKPLAVYGPAIDQRLITPATIVDDAPVHLDAQHPDLLYPQNFTRTYNGLTDIRDAIANSVNVVAAKVYLMNPDLPYSYLSKVGIDRENERSVSFALGGLQVGLSPYRMTAAYVPFANRGMFTEPYTYTKVVDKDNNVILEKKVSPTIVYSEAAAYVMTDMLKSVCTYGTAYPNGIIKNSKGEVIPTAGKTGTTSSDKDRWFVGYSPYYVSAVWYGYDTPVPLDGLTSNPSLKLWHEVMQKIHKDLPPVDFQQPSDIVRKSVCIYSGKIPTDLCSQDPRNASRSSIRYNEVFIKGTEPKDTETCDVHVAAKVDISSKDAYGRNLLAGPYCPLSLIEERVFIQRREEYKPQRPGDPYPLDWIYELPGGEYCNVHGVPATGASGAADTGGPANTPTPFETTQTLDGTNSTDTTGETKPPDGGTENPNGATTPEASQPNGN
ncbi:MAG: PBP1A family penicillin-binding protein [Clostridiales bacterium]|jgi:penicillin-binding protein 1A|nr:PBP1A family penicillin-binding protein [Eubacteriales bacterium]MDH7566783.1 PBP1A family penicillin-binding protein [Clostridiales bacterium]